MNRIADALTELRRRRLVGIEKQDPLAFRFAIFQRPISLPSKSLKCVFVNARAGVSRDLRCPIGAAGIDHCNFSEADERF